MIYDCKVAPFAGAWIEISKEETFSEPFSVAPFAGAWIEIIRLMLTILSVHVAPFAGAWIEMSTNLIKSAEFKSLPSRERGLKY